MKDIVDIELFPSHFDGELFAPPSKSLSHRALICASLAKGQSVISNVVYSDDITTTIEALKLIGAKFKKQGSNILVTGTRKIKAPNKPIYCNESGSTLRFLIPLLSLTNKEITFTGMKSLISRPQSIYKNIFIEDGNNFIETIDSIVVNGSIKARKYLIKGDVSSQFFTGLFFALPLLKEDSTIIIENKLESRSYLDLTIEILKEFGIIIQTLNNGYFIEGNQTYTPKDYQVEGDYSQAAFFMVGGILNGHIKIKDLNHDSNQGDTAIVEIIKSMKGKVIYTENGFVTETSRTTSSTIDLENNPDLGPIVALLASLSKGTTKIINAGRLRIKESDRINSIVTTLNALGANIESTEDEIIINGVKSLKGGVTIDSFNDHRIAMMISIAALTIQESVILTNANAVTKSYPNFFSDYLSVGGIYKTIKE